MTAVNLKTVWLNLASDPSSSVSPTTMASLSVDKVAPGEVRTLANGRRRVIRRAGTARSATVSVDAATRAEIEWLEDHVGEVVCVRDDRGRKFFGAYLSVGVDEIRGNNYGNVSIALTEVTYSEAV
jgi:hypothetical protein